MRTKRWSVWILLFAVLAPLAMGCGSSQDTPAAPTAPAEPTAVPATVEPSSEQPSMVTTPSATPSSGSAMEAALEHIVRLDGATLARVNGTEITWEEYEPLLRQALMTINRQYKIDWSDGAMQVRLLSLQNDVLKQAVDRWLLREMAADQGIALDEEEFEARVQDEKAQAMSSGSYADWNDFLQKNGLTDNSFRQIIHDTLLLNLMVSQQVVDTQGEQTHLRHIVVTDEMTAYQIEEELKSGGDFAELAAQYSIDEQTKNSAGDLGWFSPELMSPDIKPITDALAPGEFSEPISTQSGYAIVQVVERAMRELDARMLRQRQQDALLAQLEEVKATANIEYLVDFTADQEETP